MLFYATYFCEVSSIIFFSSPTLESDIPSLKMTSAISWSCIESKKFLKFNSKLN